MEGPAGGAPTARLAAPSVRGAAPGSDHLASSGSTISSASPITTSHGISPEVVEFRAPGGVARSTAGKIARRVNAKQFTEREHAAAE